jgi:glycosyltransferase involved in cell wall biosynthesis
MKILFIHQNFPGQFGNLSASLAKDRKNKVVALTMGQLPVPPGVEARQYSLIRHPSAEAHPMLRDQESKVLRGEACAAAALKLKADGFTPDVIIAHPGWGEALFIKDVFPKVRVVLYCEYYYAAEGQDVGFDPELPPLTFEQRCTLRMKNATNLLSMEIADAAISPTQWQKSTYPAWAQDKITVIHDGIDFKRLLPDPKATLTLSPNVHNKEPLTLKPGDEVLTYVARNLEPIRGFQMLMRCLPEILKKRPKARAVIAGGDEKGYGHPMPPGTTWRELLLKEVGGELDMSRVHFVGKVPYNAYLQMLGVSKVHAYWTAPFVLSWSFLEAASAGVPVVASDTPPVREFAGKLGVRTEGFHDRGAFARAIIEGLATKGSRRSPVQLPELDLERCLREQKKLISQA